MQHGKASVRGTSTTNILLEGAAWNFINIRKTAKQHNLPSEASFRFSRGVHPALAEQGVRRGLQLMAEWSGGKIAPGLVDEYPLSRLIRPLPSRPQDVKRWIGIDLTAEEIAELLAASNSSARSRMVAWMPDPAASAGYRRGHCRSGGCHRRSGAVTATTASPKRAWPMHFRRRSATRSMNGRSTSAISWSVWACRKSSAIA